MYGSAVILLAFQLAVSWGLQGTVPLFLENSKLDPIADRSSRKRSGESPRLFTPCL